MRGNLDIGVARTWIQMYLRYLFAHFMIFFNIEVDNRSFIEPACWKYLTCCPYSKWMSFFRCFFIYCHYCLVPHPRAQLLTYCHLQPSLASFVLSLAAQGKSADSLSHVKWYRPCCTCAPLEQKQRNTRSAASLRWSLYGFWTGIIEPVCGSKYWCKCLQSRRWSRLNLNLGPVGTNDRPWTGHCCLTCDLPHVSCPFHLHRRFTQ